MRESRAADTYSSRRTNITDRERCYLGKKPFNPALTFPRFQDPIGGLFRRGIHLGTSAVCEMVVTENV